MVPRKIQVLSRLALNADGKYDRKALTAMRGPGDVAVAISTSGNSANVLEGVKKARKRNLKTIGLTGKDGGALAQQADVAITIPSTSTARIQECHIAIGRLFCELVDADFSESKSC